MDPIRQVAPMSYIGQALGRLGSKCNLKKSSKKKSKSRKWGKRTSRDPDDDSGDSSDSSSSPSNSDTTDSASETTESSESSDSLSDGPKCSKRSRHKKKHDRKKNTLKPIPPVTYDGSPDSRSFHQFLTEGTAYVKDGKVERHKSSDVLGQGSGPQARLAQPEKAQAQPGPIHGLMRAEGRAHGIGRPIPRAQPRACVMFLGYVM